MTGGDSVVVTGMGAVSALGRGCEALWAGVEAGRDGITPLRRFDTAGFAVHLGATVPGPDGEGSSEELWKRYALEAMRQAGEQAGLDPGNGTPARRRALVLGTCMTHYVSQSVGYTEELADELGILGPRITIGTACCASTNALGLGRDLLLSGAADLVFAGGVDVLTPEIFGGFHALDVLCPEKCAPFSFPVGMSLGEGAGILVLERQRQAGRRGAAALAVLSGSGLSSDAYHETSPEPSGAGVARAVLGAIRDAGLRPAEIGYVNAHATGTEANDPAEWQAMGRVFGDGARGVALSAAKSILGHAQGAAGALEAILTVLAMRRGQLPPTLRFNRPRPRCPADPVASDRPRPRAYGHAVSTNSAFGGANAAVVLGLLRNGTPARRPLQRPVHVLGAGAVAAHGTDLEPLERALERGQPLGGRVPEFQIQRIARRADPRSLDPSARFLTAAAARALADAGVRVRGELREQTGLVVGASRLSSESVGAFRDSIERGGLPGVSANAFARMVLHATTAACARCLTLRGPTSTISSGESGGLAAVAYGAWLLSSRDDARMILAGGQHEMGPDDPRGAGEGAGCLLLGAADPPAPEMEGPPNAPLLAGWGLAGPGDLAGAIRQALDRARLQPADVEAVFGGDNPKQVSAALGGSRGATSDRQDVTAVLGDSRAAAPALACVAAVLALRRGRPRVALVTDARGSSAAAAVILVRR
jgi:3-oxoacyl-[acyl-carrier-protein] synthase II